MKTRRIHGSGHTGSNEGWAVVTTLMSGFLVWGGIGWLLDHWWGTRLLTPVGLIVGMALGIYAVVARFGLAGAREPAKAERHLEQPSTGSSPSTPSTVTTGTTGTREETSCP